MKKTMLVDAVTGVCLGVMQYTALKAGGGVGVVGVPFASGMPATPIVWAVAPSTNALVVVRVNGSVYAQAIFSRKVNVHIELSFFSYLTPETRT